MSLSELSETSSRTISHIPRLTQHNPLSLILNPQSSILTPQLYISTEATPPSPAIQKPSVTQPIPLTPSSLKMTTKGSCLCGAVEYSYTGSPMTTALCHCTDCQKWSGSAYTSNVVVPRKEFKVTKGSPKHYNVKGDSGKMNDHWFCGGSSSFF